MRAAALLLRRELALAWSGGGGPLLALAFLACLTTLIPLAVGSDAGVLAWLAGGVAWIALVLAMLLSLERLFERDLEDGALDLLTLGPLPLEAVFAVKALAQWIALGLPLAAAAPVAALALGLAPSALPVAALAGAIAGLGLAFTGALGAAVALGARRGGVLIAVVALPLFIPPVIFGAGAVLRAAEGVSALAPLAFLAAYSLFATALTPLFGAAAIRNAQG
ncbi:heme exporter protein CcmB [Brevundimonas balnearis]|uniref:Heme exporter protein B n=1 Tax=Brevundimonas balnearis TaxID=1572858 RepID=A0ABV6R381_9CAUL